MIRADLGTQMPRSKPFEFTVPECSARDRAGRGVWKCKGECKNGEVGDMREHRAGASQWFKEAPGWSFHLECRETAKRDGVLELGPLLKAHSHILCHRCTR